MPDAFSGPEPHYGMTQEYDGCDNECTCADSLAFARSNKKYKLVALFFVAALAAIVVFDNPGAYGG